MKQEKIAYGFTNPKIIEIKNKVMKIPIIIGFIKDYQLDKDRTPPETKKEIEYYLGAIITLSLELSLENTLLPLENSEKSPYTSALEQCEALINSANELLINITKLDQITKYKIIPSENELKGELNKLIERGAKTKIDYRKKIKLEKKLIIKSLKFCWENLAKRLKLNEKQIRSSTVDFIAEAINFYPPPHCEVTPDAIRKQIERI